MLVNGDGCIQQERNRRQAGVTGSVNTWHQDGFNALVIALDKTTKDSIEDGAEIQQTGLEAVRP